MNHLMLCYFLVNFSHDLNVLSVSQLSQRINSADRLYCKGTRTYNNIMGLTLYKEMYESRAMFYISTSSLYLF